MSQPLLSCPMLRPGRLLAVLLLTSGLLHGAQAQAQQRQNPVQEVLPKVVKIFGAGGIRNLQSYGTGFLVSPEGHMVTVWNHLLDQDRVTVILDDGRRYEARVLGAEPQLDLAVLQLEDVKVALPYFDLSKAEDIPAGTRVLGFSNMFKVATGDEPVSVLHGVVAARTSLNARRGAFEFPYDGPVYIVDAITNNPGAAGGVLTTRDGRLVGMIGKELRNAETSTWINYALPVTQLRETIGQIISGDFRPSRNRTEDDTNPRRYTAINFGIGLIPDVIQRTPAYVISIVEGSAAARAGLKREDLVVFLNGQLIQSCRMLQEELGWLEAGDTVKLVVRRDGQLISVELPVERLAEE
ncbi:MAG: serine protease [Planctomycetaceae bacterium]|nr:serine protease [Planctomycetaceae bacterium]